LYLFVRESDAGLAIKYSHRGGEGPFVADGSFYVSSNLEIGGGTEPVRDEG
jgi:hypothetical protein